jgi:hypothetical protein
MRASSSPAAVWRSWKAGKADGFVNSPISALRFIALSLRRTGSTPHSARFARLELGLFTKPSIRMPSYEFINAEETL